MATAGAPSRSPTSDFWYQSVPSGRNAAGFNVTEDSALTIGAVYRAIRLLADDVAQLPLHLYRRNPDRENGKPGGKTRIDSPLAEVLSVRPNERQTPFQWRQMMSAQLLAGGNGYSRIVSGARGFVDQVVPLAPHRVRPELLDSGRVLYLYRDRDGTETRLTQDEVFHLCGFQINPDDPRGLSPVGLARTSLGLSMATEEFGARQFSQTPRPSFALTSPNKIAPDRRQELAGAFRQAYSGPSGWGAVPIMDDGMTLATLGMSHDDAQFLETRQFQVTDVARWFGVPPHMIGDMSGATFSNIEQESLSYLQHSLMPYLRLWTQSIKRDLILDDANAEFVLEEFMRADTLTRAQTYQILANLKSVTPNEVRHRENMDPVPWGDKPLETQGAPAPAQPGNGPGIPAPSGTASDDDDEEDGPDVMEATLRRRNGFALNGNGHAR